MNYSQYNCLGSIKHKFIRQISKMKKQYKVHQNLLGQKQLLIN